MLVSTCCYTKIYRKLLHHHAQVRVPQRQSNGTEPLIIARYRKTVSSALWVHLTLVTCYFPVGVVAALIAIKGITSYLALVWIFLVTVVHFNSTLNPILYCWKIKEVRRAVIATIRQISGSWISPLSELEWLPVKEHIIFKSLLKSPCDRFAQLKYL